MTRGIDQLIERQVHHWDRMAAALGRMPEDHLKQSAPVVCISRNLGSGAREIAASLAKALGCEVFGRDVIEHIANDLHVQRSLIDERDEHFRSELELVMKSWMGQGYVAQDQYFRSLTKAILGVARRGGVVFLGRGAQFILGEKATLRVCITAPYEFRVHHLSRRECISEEEARRRISDFDRDRQEFIHRLFRVSPRDQDHVDLLLNTSRIPVEQCSGLILQALRACGAKIELCEQRR